MNDDMKAKDTRTGWQTLASAPVHTPVMVETEKGYRFPAQWDPQGAVGSNEEVCGCWLAAVEGFHPPCWTDGQCWSVNENDEPSDWPVKWRSL